MVTTNLNLNVPTKKLQNKRVGPFEITKVMGQSTYQLRLPSGWRAFHPVFNESLLTPYTPPFAKHQQKPLPPPPEIIDDVPEHLVEKIKNSNKNNQYYVEWVGHSREHDSWEPWGNLKNAKQSVHEFHLNNPKKPKSIGYKRWLEQDGHRAETPDP